jgi:hypothetical protein
VILVLCFINWWGTRQPHSLGPDDGGKIDRKADGRNRIEPRTPNGADDQPAKGKNKLAGR